MTAPQNPRVTQADREAAREAFLLFNEIGDEANSLTWGWRDENALVQAFARHREAAEAVSKAREAALVEAVERHLKWLNNLPIPTTGCTAQMIELRAALAKEPDA